MKNTVSSIKSKPLQTKICVTIVFLFITWIFYEVHKMGMSTITTSIRNNIEFLTDADLRENITNICESKSFHQANVFRNNKQGIPGYQRRLTDECYRSDSPIKYILHLHPLWGLYTEEIGRTMFDECPVKNCVVTRNRSLMPIEEFDAIFLDVEFYTNITKRTGKQYYLFFSVETPYLTTYASEYSKPHVFNLTLNYRRDADIHYPYALVKKVSTNYTLPTLERIRNKTKVAAWFVSNCNAKRRLEYVEELKKYLHVVVYGACGTLQCGKDNREGCLKMVEDNYMFYLAFENAMCFDYVTEKIFHLFKYDIVPVVFGGANYDSIAPPKSVIVANDFPTPKALADYLNKLSQNPQEYLSYFEWKKDYVIFEEPYKLRYAYCQLCDLLHRNLSHSSYENVKAWQFSKSCYY